MFLLDANACIAILNDASAALVARVRSEHPSRIRLSSVVKAELLDLARKSASPAANLRLLERFFAPLRSLPFDDACSEQYALIRSDLERTGKPIGPCDMMIAATALAHGLTLVTHNAEGFSRVAGLKWEDWEA